MENSLDSILSEKPAAAAPEVTTEQQPAETQAAPEVTTETQAASTGEQTGTPPEKQKDEPLDKAAEGLKAAATAERRKRQEAEQREATLRQELDALRRQNQPQVTQQSQQQDADQKPLRQDFASEDEWLDARDAWRDRVQVSQAQARQQQEQERTRAQKSESIIAEAMKLEGFDLQAFARVPITDAMFDAITESDAAARLVHHLQTHPEEATRIASLSTAKQIAELTRIEDKLTAAPPQDPPEKKPEVPLPKTLTQTRNAQGRFEQPYSGPTPLTAILASK